MEGKEEKAIKDKATILIVDDNVKNRHVLKDMVLSFGHIPVLAENGIEALSKMKEQSPDMVLLDILMPEMSGFEVLDHMKGNNNLRHIPVIMISAVDHIYSVIKCIEKGADDYFDKPFNPKLLKARMDSSLEKKRLRDIEKEYRLRLEHLSITDGLTGIANRRFFDDFLQKEWYRALRLSKAISLIMVDVDFFKIFNDTYGHPSGDRCLTKVANTLKHTLKRAGEIVARYGGEEFIIVMPNTQLKDAIKISKEISAKIRSLEIENKDSTVSAYITVSMGIANVVPRNSSSPSAFIDKADKALYKAKAEGRNRYSVFETNSDS